MKLERVVGWALILGGGFTPGVAWLLRWPPLGEGTRTVLSLLLVSGMLVLYAGDRLRFARKDPIGFASIAIPVLALPVIGLVIGYLLVGSILGIALALAFVIWGDRTWPVWRRLVLRRPAVSRERQFERAALSHLRSIIGRLIGAVDDPKGCAAHLQIARREVLDLAALHPPNPAWAGVRDGYVDRLNALLDQSHDPATLKRALKTWAEDDEVRALRDRFDDLAGAPRRAAERAAVE